jgi:hypothetical protein
MNNFKIKMNKIFYIFKEKLILSLILFYILDLLFFNFILEILFNIFNYFFKNNLSNFDMFEIIEDSDEINNNTIEKNKINNKEDNKINNTICSNDELTKSNNKKLFWSMFCLGLVSIFSISCYYYFYYLIHPPSIDNNSKKEILKDLLKLKRELDDQYDRLEDLDKKLNR